MKWAAIAGTCLLLLAGPEATASPGMAPEARAHPYTAQAVMRVYARARLGLFSEGLHRFGAGRALYLTLVPYSRVVKGGLDVRGAYFSVLVFQNPIAARKSLTPRVKAEMRAGKLPWVLKGNLILASRVAIPQPNSGTFGPDTNATWRAAKAVLAKL